MEAQQSVIDLIFALFLRLKRWPTWEVLDHELDVTLGLIEPWDAVDAIDRSLLWGVGDRGQPFPQQEIGLSLAGLVTCQEAEADLQAFVTAVAFAAKTAQETPPPGEARLFRTQFANRLQLPTDVGDDLLDRQLHLWLATGALFTQMSYGSDTDVHPEWSVTLKRQVLRRLRGVSDVKQVIDVTQPSTQVPRRIDASEVEVTTEPVDPSEVAAPKVFFSYSWDSENHQAWVLQLAHRLRTNGIDVILDQWDTRLGSDLPHFMEAAGNADYRVVAVVTENYVTKANTPTGGVGYERRVLTAALMSDLGGNRVIPVLRSGSSLPTFLGATKYVDFCNDSAYEEKYVELLRELHGVPVPAKPPLGPNPFATTPADAVDATLRENRARYVSPAAVGDFFFDYENNNGSYVIGTGETAFTLRFSTSGHGSIHVYTDGGLKSLALVPDATRPEDIGDASLYDGSSRVRTPRVGDAVVVRNGNDYWAAIFVDEVLTRDSNQAGHAWIKARYVIQGSRSRLFGAIQADE